MAVQNEYWKLYWHVEGDGINEKRKSKYNSDPDYAEKQRQAARDYRKRRKEERDEAIKRGELVLKGGGGPRKPKLVDVNGDKVEAVTIGYVSNIVGVSLSKLDYWKRVGILPNTPFNKSERLYTYAMIDVIKRAVDSRGKIFKKDKGFFKEIVSGWEDLGVI